ncbi:MAG TPA: ABC transporter ATP-binding protein [Cellulomonas sp.]
MIRFEGVGFRYASAAAGTGVRDIDLEVAPGECVLVCGASGSGKTTLARLANGLAPSFLPGDLTGRVLVDGADLATLTSWERARRTGSVFQNPRTQFFTTDVASEVAFGLESLAWPEDRLRARTAEVMSARGLVPLAGRSIFSLSGGEKQRVAFASVHAPAPGSYVLDEPTSNLDATAIDRLRADLALVKASGASILVAEHRLHWLRGIVDRVVWLDDGRIGRVLSGEELWALDAGERAAMGLRAVDLAQVEQQALAPVAPAPLLVAEELAAAYRGHPVLAGVDLAVGAGEVVALTGANGAGKSTLSRLLCGLHRRGSGRVVFAGRTWGPRERRRRSAMVFQDVNYQLFAESVAEEVAFGLTGVPPGRVADLLGALGLDGLADRHPATLSGGQKQRLAVAASLAAGKRVLVFDEPTSGLDLAGMHRVADLLRDVAARGTVVLVATHDLELVSRACTRVLHLSEGGVAADRPLDRASAPFVAGLLGGTASVVPTI